MQFTKPPKSFNGQLDLLIERGMVINNHDRAKRYLAHLNYYRLAAYWLPYEQDHSSHQFKPGTDFELILEHYIFDRELRLLLMDAIERIEVSLRTRWAYHLSHAHGPHAHLNADLFKEHWPPSDTYQYNVELLRKSVRRSSEIFIRHFKKYDEDLPPLWAICEIMTLGQLSKWYANLKHSKDRNVISRSYDLDEVILTSFLRHLSIVRNHCAHHARLWNREFTFAWKFPKKRPENLIDNFNLHDGKRLYNTLVMLAYLMDSINPHSWKDRLNNLFERHPDVQAVSMGFPNNWQELPIWHKAAEPVFTN